MAAFPGSEAPHRALLPKGNNSYHGIARLRAISSGLVGTVFGMGTRFTATLVGTGEYNLRFARTVWADIIPHYNGPGTPSGVAGSPTGPGEKLDLHVTDINGPSGTAKLWVSKQQAFVVPSSISFAAGGSGLMGTSISRVQNLPTGAEVTFYVEDSPQVAY